MLSTPEKLIILRSVSLFGETPDKMLAELADLLEEVVLEAGATLFEYGDHGDAMYIMTAAYVSIAAGVRWMSLGSTWSSVRCRRWTPSHAALR